MANEQFDADVVVIGAGPGGYVAAIRAPQSGLKTICVEKEYLGGTCLNWGCIPSKAMIAGVERLNHVKHAGDFGVTISGDIGFDFEAYSKRRDKIVQTQRGGIGMLFKKNNIRHVEGFAAFKDKNTIEVSKDGKVVVFYQPASKFDTRYGTVGFNEDALLDDGVMWPTAYAVIEVTDAVESALRDIVRRAAG